MLEKPKFPPGFIEGGDLQEKDGTQRNIYIDTIADKELRYETNERKDTEKSFNVSRLLMEGWALYKLVKHYHKQAQANPSLRNYGSLHELASDALKYFVNRKK